jgi:uncharacterized membrane protein
MQVTRRRLYAWAIFVALLLVFLAAVWMIFHIEPTVAPDYQGSLSHRKQSRPLLLSAASRGAVGIFC